jgi:hypothetical protein
MFRLLAATLALAVASTSPARADDKEKEKPNTLTPKEIAEGWILLFDGESTFGWKINGAAEVKDGVLILGKGKKTIAYPASNFADFSAAVEWRGKGVVHCELLQASVESSATSNDSKQWANCELERTGRQLVYHFPNATGSDKKAQEPRLELKTSPFVIETDGKTEFHVRTTKLRPINTKPLFNSKNLDGWKVNGADMKRMASKWTVTPAGELSVKNGPGDLVSDKQFDNFVLQFECKTLGKSLNSGVFFRCIPGQYQNGYEAQVQSAYKDNDRTKPADFGTGAIYRRVPARKVVSNDNEWFTMTVVADGKHISTWVNGYQTVDWADDRKADENPRKGFRAAKGPLSIQGHDPTTDILYRNIRVAELPPK